MKPGSDEADIKLRHTKDQELQNSILSGETSPVVELDKIDPAEGGKDMPPTRCYRIQHSNFAPDEETRVAAETLEALQGQQWTASLPENSILSTPPGEADYFDGGGLMETVRQSQRRWKIHSAPVSQQSAPNTPAGLITTISVGIVPPARVVAEDLTKANLREGSPNLLQMASSGVGKQVTSESMDSRSAGGLGGTKNNQASSSKPKVPTMHSSGPGPSGGAAGGSG